MKSVPVARVKLDLVAAVPFAFAVIAAPDYFIARRDAARLKARVMVS